MCRLVLGLYGFHHFFSGLLAVIFFLVAEHDFGFIFEHFHIGDDRVAMFEFSRKYRIR